MFRVLRHQLAVAELPDPHGTISSPRGEVLQRPPTTTTAAAVIIVAAIVVGVVGGDGQRAVSVGGGQQPLHLAAERVRAANGAVLPAGEHRVGVRQRQTEHGSGLGAAQSGQTGVVRQVPGAYLAGYAAGDEVVAAVE